ncbi:MAG: hypothetical protein FJ241_12045 [Nitrospira sp.]|nr:hypothetical protein [Nitrospira sp.]
MYKKILSNPIFYSLIILIIIVNATEVMLLELKYNFFSGGFLQSHKLRGAGEVVLFSVASFWFDFIFLGLIALIWNWLGSKLKINPFIISYHYLFVAGFLCMTKIAVHYKLMSYFSDTVNFHLIKNLGGDSFRGALTYVSKEMVLSSILASLFFGAYLSGYFIVRRVSQNLQVGSNVKLFSLKRASRVFIGIILLSAIIVAFFVNKQDNVRYGLNKKTSFSVINNIFSLLTDFDVDGFSYFSFPVDPEPFDAAVYPGALDVPDNGTDEDGFLGDFHYIPQQKEIIAEPKPSDDLKHIILIVLESARGDLIEKEIDGRPVAPNLMDLVKKGTYYKYAYSHNGYTAPTLKAIFTGSLNLKNVSESIFSKLNRIGYEISVFSCQDESFGGVDKDTKMKELSNFFFDARTGIDERVFPSTAASSLRLDEKTVLREIRNRLLNIDWRRPQFMYINFQAAHFPYYHPGMPQLLHGSPISRSNIKSDNHEWVGKTYWNALAYADMMLGEVVSELKNFGVFSKSMIIVTGDHGESLFDDGFLGHGHRLNEIQTRVPLVFSIKGIKAEEPIGHADLLSIIINAISKQKNIKAGGESNRLVFQYIGELNNPIQIGIVEINEQRTVLDLRTKKCFFSDLGIWEDYDKLNGNLFVRIKRLILEWERLRWEVVRKGLS